MSNDAYSLRYQPYVAISAVLKDPGEIRCADPQGHSPKSMKHRFGEIVARYRLLLELNRDSYWNNRQSDDKKQEAPEIAPIFTTLRATTPSDTRTT